MRRRPASPLVFAAISTLYAALALSACAAPSRYMGIDITAAAPDRALADLASRAQAGNKQAQLELGIAYEEGRGVPRDLRRAAALYRLASADSGGARWVWVPGVGGQPGRVQNLGGGQRQRGLAEARTRLRLLAAAR